MRLDIAKIDERIKRLQELRRLACDPEIASILLECLTGDESEVGSHLDSVRTSRMTDEPDELIRDIAANGRR
jgi:hypothetical protein